MISITSEMISLHFLDHLWLFHSLNAVHFESSIAYNFLICEKKHQEWAVIFLVRTWGRFWYQNNSDLLNFFRFWIFNTSRFIEWGNACNLCYATSSTNYDVAYDITCLAFWHLICIKVLMTIDHVDWSRYSVTNTSLASLTVLWFGLKQG